MEPVFDDLEEELEDTITNFYSEDKLHFVVWDYWHDEKNGISYDTWVCTTHNKQYYHDCAQKA